MSILNAIKEGRPLFDITQKLVLHALAANVAFVISVLVDFSFKDDSCISSCVFIPVKIDHLNASGNWSIHCVPALDLLKMPSYPIPVTNTVAECSLCRTAEGH